MILPMPTRWSLWAFLCVVSTGSLHAAVPSIETVSPAVGQRGSTFTLNLIGAALDDAEEVLFYRTGVTCAELKATSENELTLKLIASPDCPLGSHGFRLRTRRGITELRVFRVTAYPVVLSQQPGTDGNPPQAVDHNVTVVGVLESGDVDAYRVSLKKGDAFSAEVEAIRLGANLLDTVLTVRDPDGQVLATVDDTPLFRQDPFATIVAPRDGTYTVEVRETNNEGDGNSRYALHLGRFPRPAAIYPAGGPSGEAVTVHFLGDAGGPFTQTVTPTAGFELFAERNGMRSPTPHPFRVSSFPNVLEPESPDVAATHPATLPVAFNGRIGTPAEHDTFSFAAEGGQTWQFDLLAERMGSPLDAVMMITDDNGAMLARCDDYDSHDPRIVWTAPQSGTYRLVVTDKREAGGPMFVYRVEATLSQPQLTAFLPRPNRTSQERQTLSVPRGNRVVTFVAARRQGVTGPLQFSAGELPSGVVMNARLLADDQFWTPVVVEAAAEAPIGGRLSLLEVSGQAEGRSVFGAFRQVVDLVNGPADALYQAYVADRWAVAVTEAVPFHVHLDPPVAGLSQDGTIALKVRVERHADFMSPIDVTFPFLPPWVDGPDKLTIPANETEGLYLARAWKQAGPRTWPICAEAKPGLAQATAPMAMEMPATGRPGRGRRSRNSTLETRVSSALVDLTIIPPPVTGTMPSAAGEQGKTTRLICQLAVDGDLPESMVATLEGLPNRVTAEPVMLTRGDRRVEFVIHLSDDAPLGEFSSLVCRLSGQLKGQNVSYCVGRGCVLETRPPGKLVTDANGRPLSRLEVLRQEKAAKKPADGNP